MKYVLATPQVEAEADENTEEFAYACLMASMMDDESDAPFAPREGVLVFDGESGVLLGRWSFVFEEAENGPADIT